MRRILLIPLVAIAMVAALGVGVVLGLVTTPVQAQVARALQADLNNLQNRSRLAIQAQTQTPPLADQTGILVAGVASGSPAESAGLKRGDIVLQVDGQPVDTLQQLQAVLSRHNAGDSVELLVQHGDEQKTLTATLANLPAGSQGANNGQPTQPPSAALPYLGIVPCEMGARMNGSMFRSNQPGAAIQEVTAGSPAAKAGLQAGEIILAVDGQQVGPDNDLASLITAHKPGDTVRLEVSPSGGGSREVSVTLGDNPQKPGAAWLGIQYAPLSGMGPNGMIPALPGTPNNGGNGTPQPNNPGLPVLPGLQHPGAIIREVVPDGPAEKAGLQAGQLIQAVDGQDLTTQKDLATMIAAHKPGDTITLTVYDMPSSTAKDVQVTLGENPQKAGAAWLGVRVSYLQFDLNPNPTQEPENGPQG